MYKSHLITPVALLLAAIVTQSGLSVQAADGPNAATEKELIDALRSAAPPEKAMACKKLVLHGTKEAVPELAKLLPNEQLSSWARIALEAIPDPAADEALRKATETLEGKLLVGVINSIGVRRDAGAVDHLTKQLKNSDAQAASAAAVALGHIADAAATDALRQSLTTSSTEVRSAVAEGCILCAERLMADGKASEASKLYDEVRKADVPKQKTLEATRGAILARKSDGVPLLLEQLRSSDKAQLNFALSTARELPGREVAEALAAELSKAPPERAALLIYALADRKEAVVPPAVLEAAKTGPKPVRIAAVGLIGRTEDSSGLSTLLSIATEKDEELSLAAKTALASLPGKNVDKEIASQLRSAEGAKLAVLIELVGQRRIDATDTLVKLLENSDARIRSAALTALGATASQKELQVLIAQVKRAESADGDVAARALRAAAVRMPDREACAAELAAAMKDASIATKATILEILGTMGGAKALETIAASAKSGEDQLADVGTRVLGEWMNTEAAPVLLDLATSETTGKYQVRALRGYIRLARQFAMPDGQRAEMCRKALEASKRPEEQKLVLAVLERYPSTETLKVAVQATEVPGLKEEATRVAMAIAQKIGAGTAEAKELLDKIGLKPMKVEIIKAEYGAGTSQKDVTDALKKHVRDLPLIALPNANYNASFGGDPVPNTPKKLKVRYRVDGKEADVSFAENAAIILPMPK